MGVGQAGASLFVLNGSEQKATKLRKEDLKGVVGRETWIDSQHCNGHPTAK
jgi:hypothetical protein